MSLNRSYQEPVYLISEVAKILEIHPQTLRQYEREGLQNLFCGAKLLWKDCRECKVNGRV